MENKTTNDIPESISWKAQSHQQFYRSPGWYLAFGLISLGLIIFGIYNRSIITIITFIVIILCVMVMLSQPPSNRTYKLTKTGLIADNTIYPYKIVKTFWIVYNPPEVKTLNFETTAYLNNLISFELGDTDPVNIKLFLSQYLREDLDREESLTETLSRKLKI